jgi:galactoside O-acetyltransferase
VRFDRWCYFTARGGEIYIGEGTFLNTQVILNADLGGKIHIASNCIIGPRVIFRTANHNFENLNKLKSSQGHTKKDIYIAANVWIGANVTVLPGVSIGKNSVIGAGAVVTKNVPENCLAVGVPAEIKKRLKKSD